MYVCCFLLFLTTLPVLLVPPEEVTVHTHVPPQLVSADFDEISSRDKSSTVVSMKDVNVRKISLFT